jgi:exodeoxyribonuclease VIII
MAGAVLRNHSWENYLKTPGVNISKLKRLQVSPLHYLAGETKDTKSMGFGRAVHCAVLEPMRFVREYVEFRGDRRGKGWKQFKEANGKKTILTEEEATRCACAWQAVRSSKEAGQVLRPGHAEVTILWEDEDTGLECKGRLDWLTFDDLIVDLKTANRVGPADFQRQSASLGYHLQFAFYLDGLRSAGVEPKGFAVVAVESSPPWDVVVYQVPEETLAQGRGQYKELLWTLKRCQDSKSWPGQGGGQVQELDLPAWMGAVEDETELVIGGEKVVW